MAKLQLNIRPDDLDKILDLDSVNLQIETWVLNELVERYVKNFYNSPDIKNLLRSQINASENLIKASSYGYTLNSHAKDLIKKEVEGLTENLIKNEIQESLNKEALDILIKELVEKSINKYIDEKVAKTIKHLTFQHVEELLKNIKLG